MYFAENPQKPQKVAQNCLFYLSLISLICTAWFPAAAQTVAIIDVHAHLSPGPAMNFERALQAAIRTMDRNGIATSVLMSPPRGEEIQQNYDVDDFREALEEYPGRFVYLGGGGALNPTLHSYQDISAVTDEVRRDFGDEARRLLDKGAIGFGEISSLHISLAPKHGYNYVPADHPLLRVLADVAAETDVPIDLHMDAVAEPMAPPPELAKFPNNPETFPATLAPLERLLSHNPNAKIVWAHGGTDHLGDFSAAIIGDLMDRNDNLYVSLKVVGPKGQSHNKIMGGGTLDAEWRSLLSRHSDRFMIGTDNFYVDPDGTGAIAEFEDKSEPRLRATSAFLSLLPADLARKIGRDNALQIYRLSPEQAPSEIPSVSSSAPSPKPVKRAGGTCRDGNMSACDVACQRGIKQACARLRRGN